MTRYDVGAPKDGIVTEEVPTDAVARVAEAELPTCYGNFRIAAFRVRGAPAETVVLFHGDPESDEPPLVRLHSECLTGDVLGSLRCDCGEQLDASLEQISRATCGILLYLRQEGRGIGLANKIRAYALQDVGLDTVDANIALGLPVDGRDYSAAAAVLLFLGVRAVRLLTNNPAKCAALQSKGVGVVERVPLLVPPNPSNAGYMQTKATRMGHLFGRLLTDEQAEPEAG